MDFRKFLLRPWLSQQLIPVVGTFILMASVSRGALAQTTDRLEFTRMVAHWADYAREDYLSFIDDAQPELVQPGFCGAHFWSLAHTPQYSA